MPDQDRTAAPPVTPESHSPTELPALVAPAVSIVICNHDYRRYVVQAVESALAQQPPCQVIVVDDGSTDGSQEVLARLHPRVEVILQANGGQLAACNTGYARCTGDVVVFLDADDLLEPHAVQRVLPLFTHGVAKVHWRMAMVDEAGQPLGGVVPANLGHGDMRPALQRHGVLYPSAPGSGNAYRRDVLQRLFPLPVDAHDRVAADFFLVYGAVAWGTVAACDEVLGRYRLHRPPRQAADALVFGNAALGNDEAAKVGTRYQRLRAWLAERSGGAVRYAPQFLDFSVQKTPYAQAVLGQPYLQALATSWGPLARLLRAVWRQPVYGLKKKAGLSAWALLVLLTPRRTALRLARYVCNPASRAS